MVKFSGSKHEAKLRRNSYGRANQGDKLAAFFDLITGSFEKKAANLLKIGNLINF